MGQEVFSLIEICVVFGSILCIMLGELISLLFWEGKGWLVVKVADQASLREQGARLAQTWGDPFTWNAHASFSSYDEDGAYASFSTWLALLGRAG